MSGLINVSFSSGLYWQVRPNVCCSYDEFFKVLSSSIIIGVIYFIAFDLNIYDCFKLRVIYDFFLSLGLIGLITSSWNNNKVICCLLLINFAHLGLNIFPSSGVRAVPRDIFPTMYKWVNMNTTTPWPNVSVNFYWVLRNLDT